ncbi:MAG: fatty acid desaturase family protein [Marmoricola sp.]
MGAQPTGAGTPPLDRLPRHEAGVASRPPRGQSLYTDLARDIRSSGLLERRVGYYWTRIGTAVVAFVLLWVGFFVLGASWYQLLLAAGLGLLMTQFGFLGHDAAHRQIFGSARWNDGASRVFASVFAGMSHGWWRSKHNRHHAAPNQQGRDPDIKPGPIAFTAEDAQARTRGPAHWFLVRQGWLFFPLLTLESLNLQQASISPLFAPGTPWLQRVEAVLVALRLAGYIAVLLLVLSPAQAAVFFAVQSAVFGLCLGGSFAPNHKGMPIVPPTARIDFLRRQVLMSRNIRGGFWVDTAMGGLNYQIEHHLFPSMPRPNLKRAQPIVRAYCDQHGVSYTETGLFRSYGIVVGYLNEVGLRARGPFDCPMVSLMRD